MHRIATLAALLNDRRLLGEGAVVGMAGGALDGVCRKWKGKRLWVMDGPPAVASAHGPRPDVVRLDGPAAVEGVSPNSLDLVYLNAGPSCQTAAAALSAWWPKLRTGGVIAGGNYLDGGVQGANYGVRSAVDAFAALHGLPIRLTLDAPPAWYAVKGETPPAVGSLKIGLLTAFDPAQRPLADISSPNKRAYCTRHGYEFIGRTGGFDAGRHPVWGKVKFLRELLPRFDWLFWSDADSLVLRPDVPLERFLPGEGEGGDMVIGLEDMGIGVFHVNAGQFFIRNSRWSLKFLEGWYALEQFEADALREQRALIHLIETRDLSRRVRLVPQRRFNAYPVNYRARDFLLHFPDLPTAEKLRLMWRGL